MIELMIKDIEYFRTKNDSTVVNILKTSLYLPAEKTD